MRRIPGALCWCIAAPRMASEGNWGKDNLHANTLWIDGEGNDFALIARWGSTRSSDRSSGLILSVYRTQ